MSDAIKYKLFKLHGRQILITTPKWRGSSSEKFSAISLNQSRTVLTAPVALEKADKSIYVPGNYCYHVLSIGALGIHLNNDEQIAALKEAVRITAPGGSMLFTHFSVPGEQFTGNIGGCAIYVVEKSFWPDKLKELGIDNVRFHDMNYRCTRISIRFHATK
jgi:hypothetical protein